MESTTLLNTPESIEKKIEEIRRDPRIYNQEIQKSILSFHLLFFSPFFRTKFINI